MKTDSNEKLPNLTRSYLLCEIRLSLIIMTVFFLSVSIVISFLPAAALESPMLAQSTAQPAQSHGVQAKEEINRENIAAGSHIFILLWTSQL